MSSRLHLGFAAAKTTCYQYLVENNALIEAGRVGPVKVSFDYIILVLVWGRSVKGSNNGLPVASL